MRVSAGPEGLGRRLCPEASPWGEHFLLMSLSTVMPGHLRIENYFCCVDFEVLSGEGLSPARSVSGCRGALGLMWWTTTGPPWVLTLALVRIRTQLQRARLCPISESRRQTKQSHHVRLF